MLYWLRVKLADALDWVDHRILDHRCAWFCLFVHAKVYPDDWCSEHGRFQGDNCPECEAGWDEFWVEREKWLTMV